MTNIPLSPVCFLLSCFCFLIFSQHHTDQLYFSSTEAPTTNSNASWIPMSNDSTLVYTAFFADFGPFDLGLTYKFCHLMQDKLNQAASQHKAVVYFASHEPQKRANSATLLLAYLVSFCCFSPSCCALFFFVCSICLFIYCICYWDEGFW